MRLVQRLSEARLRGAGALLHRGEIVSCPCCGSAFDVFAPLHGENRLCWRCGSLERDRLLWLFLDSRPQLLADRPRLLHVAPERSLRERLRTSASQYLGGDLDAAFADRRIDVTALEFGDDAFDAVVCNHVLEHVPDDRRAMRELRRVLRPGGWAVLLVPDVDRSETLEDPSVTDRAERERLFGQVDHVRRYGWDYLDRLLEAGLQPEVVDMEAELGPGAIERHRLRKLGATEPIFVCR